MKEESMSVLKDFITKHNVPNDVPDETDDISSEEDDETPLKVTVKSKKQRKWLYSLGSLLYIPLYAYEKLISF